jgi:hypothetical protein
MASQSSRTRSPLISILVITNRFRPRAIGKGKGSRSDKGPIRVAIGTPERQKKPSVTRSFNRLLPALYCHGILGRFWESAGTERKGR